MAKKITVFDCNLCYLPRITNLAGNITVVENNIQLPFSVKRIFYLYDIPGGESRGAHAHKNCHQFLIAASGSFEVSLDDGKVQRIVLLNTISWTSYSTRYLGIGDKFFFWFYLFSLCI